MTGVEAAVDAARWIRGGAEDRGGARTWPSRGYAEGGPDDVTLARGPAGVALFLLRLFEALADEAYLEDARAGIATVLRAVGPAAPPGLYTGSAGTAYVLAEAHRLTGDERYRDEAVRLADRLARSAPRWGNALDVFDGSAGVGMVLLRLGQELGDPALTAAAVAAAEDLVAAGVPQPTGTMWHSGRSAPADAADLPNFAHGTAGVACFLALAAIASGRRDLLDAAISGGNHLLSRAVTDGGGCDVPSNAEGVGTVTNWCQGAAGTGRLWYVLHQATGDPVWQACLDGAVRSVTARLLPGGQVRGAGNDTTRCCGSAGMADFLLDVHRATGRTEPLDGVRRIVRHIGNWSTRDDAGLRWIQARAARTGWLNGASGTAALLLRWGLVESGRDLHRPLPDSPFVLPAAGTASDARQVG